MFLFRRSLITCTALAFFRGRRLWWGIGLLVVQDLDACYDGVFRNWWEEGQWNECVSPSDDYDGLLGGIKGGSEGCWRSDN